MEGPGNSFEYLINMLRQHGPLSAMEVVNTVIEPRGQSKKGLEVMEKFSLEKGSDERKTIDEWLYAVELILSPEMKEKMNESLLILGLGILDSQLMEQLEMMGIWREIEATLPVPLESILNEKGKELLFFSESVLTLADPPLENIEEDKLGRAEFARFLAKRLSHLSTKEATSYAVHIYGPWGAGKSTILKFLVNVLTKEEKSWLAVEFNAWRHQHIKPSWWALLDAIYHKTKKDLPVAARIEEFWWRFSFGRPYVLMGLVFLFLITWLLFFLFLDNTIPVGRTIKTAGNVLALVSTIAVVSASVVRFFSMGSSRAAQSYMDSVRDPMNTIKERFNKLINRLKSKKVVILIDDLDRCRSSYVIELLEGIQTLFREAQVVYIVAADRRWLNACYEEVYRDFQPWVHAPGKSLGTLFLEKAFQLSTPVPGIPRHKKKQYWQSLLRTEYEKTEIKDDQGNHNRDTFSEEQKIKINEEILKKRLQLLGSPEHVKRTEHALRKFEPLLESNPRAMKRLVNAYITNRALALISGTDIEQDQLALWTIISLRWPKLADILVKNPEIINRQNTDGLDDEIRQLLTDITVVSIFNGSVVGTSLEQETIKKCAQLHV